MRTLRDFGPEIIEPVIVVCLPIRVQNRMVSEVGPTIAVLNFLQQVAPA